MKSPSTRWIFLFVFLFLWSGFTHEAKAASETNWNFGIPQKGYVSLLVGSSSFAGANYSVLPNQDHSKYISVFPPCELGEFKNCIISLESKRKSDLDWSKGTVGFSETPNSPGAVAINYANGTQPHLVGKNEEDISKGIPTGRTSSIWNLPSTPHKGGSQYLVSASFDNFNIADVNNPVNFQVSVNPIVYSPALRKSWGPIDSVMAYSDFVAYPDDVEFRISIRMGITAKMISTFFNGRIKSPQIDIANDILTISGFPEEHPQAQTEFLKYADLSNAERAILPASFDAKWFETNSFFPGLTNDSVKPFANFSIWEPKIRQIGTVKSWFVNSSNRVADCQISTLSGFVSSNALLYSTRAPEWNPSSNSLGYQLASTHLDHDGNVNRGNMDLVLSPELTKCLWKFNPVDIQSASVQISYANGDPIVGVSTVKVVKNWVYINVSGYTFSDPFVQIKLVSSKNKSLEKPSISVNSHKKSSIVCVKGKTSKKITGNSPKCPAGFKKRN
jgi:hypothetical protein